MIQFLAPILLQIQRNLQLRIEEQGKYLQMMFEKQSMSNHNKFETSSTVEPSTAATIDPPVSSQAETEVAGAKITDTSNNKQMAETYNTVDNKSSSIGGSHSTPCDSAKDL